MLGFFTLAMFKAAYADDIKILTVDLYKGNDKSWLFKVTLKHNDTGWEHYADKWQVVDANGNVLGHRTLHHPHVNEQPFTRNLTGVVIPAGVTTIFIKAHDKVHGWTPNILEIDLTQANGKHLRVETK